MAKSKKRVGKQAKKTGKTAAKRKPAATATSGQRPIVIPGAWPFPMGSKS